MSEDQVAEALGVTRATVRAWETGRSSPRGRKREAYARLLGVYEEPTAPRTEKPARPSPAGTRPRPAAKGADRPPKTPTAPSAASAARATPEPVEPHRPWEAARPPEERLKPNGSPADSPVLTPGQDAGASTAAEAHARVDGAQASSGPAPGAGTEPAPEATDGPTAGAARAARDDTGTDDTGAGVAGAGAVGSGTRVADAGVGVARTGTDDTGTDDAGAGVARTGTAGAGTDDAGAGVAGTGMDGAGSTAAVVAVDACAGAPGREDGAAAQDAAEGPEFTPEAAFDALYAYAAPSLVHQTYLLTGRRRLSRESVEFAFHHAWQHWPEVAVDRDPVGWVRAAAYEYALSPWHRFRRRHRHPDSAPTEASRRALLGALLELPPPYRRTVLLYDGLGLDLPETAAETEASTPAAGNRLLHARTVIGQRVPELSDPEALHRRLAALVAEAPTATLPAARAVRTGSERRSRRLTRTVIGVTAALICITAVTAATAPTQYIPVIAPGEVVEGVPVRGGPQKLGPEDRRLRDRLRSAPHPGPERLVPAAE
ncbi:sigma factor-like helix-turn-helix DNA-binding protein [Streptomyces sp. NPDC059071]|uniref:sigma factor-like helix-turn-helix DNA-binding protein n=1 Tax=unclassified Streptomyces TaxID=2593676 RepID=UPI00364FF578